MPALVDILNPHKAFSCVSVGVLRCCDRSFQKYPGFHRAPSTPNTHATPCISPCIHTPHSVQYSHATTVRQKTTTHYTTDTATE